LGQPRGTQRYRPTQREDEDRLTQAIVALASQYGRYGYRLEGKGRRIRTLAIPIWVKHSINAWMTAAGIEDGRLLRSVSKSGKVNRDTLSDWAVWSVVEQSSKQIGIEHFGAHDLRRRSVQSC
jgi:integrase